MADSTTKLERKLLNQFDFFIRRMRPILDNRYGKGLSKQIVNEGREEFRLIIPSLPDVGSRGLLALFSNATGMYLAMYKTALKHSRSLEETGKVIYNSAEYLLQHIPRVLSRMFAGMNFSTRYLSELQRQAADSRTGKFPDGYVFDYIEGSKQTFDYGIDYRECASVKFLKKQGAPELAAYLCPIDILYSTIFGWGLHRTMTIADGDPRCDFRFKRGGTTDVVVKVKYPVSQEKILL